MGAVAIGGRNSGQGVQGIHLEIHLLDLEAVRYPVACLLAGENLIHGLARMVRLLVVAGTTI